MLLRRYKINSAKQGTGALEKDPVHQEALYGDELKYEAEPEKHSDKPTKTEINRMPIAELRQMAVNSGLEGVEEMTGSEIKAYLIEVLGL
nr:MAG TPA: Rho termination factor, N-terminal domain [Caudoviricetes sp.]